MTTPLEAAWNVMFWPLNADDLRVLIAIVMLAIIARGATLPRDPR